jgi:hypothetical protein
MSNPPIRSITYVAELGVFVAVYEASAKTNQYPKNAR